MAHPSMETQEIWEGVVQAKLPAATADQAWSLLKDFGNLHELLPGLETCHLIDGAVDGVPGCTRHCAGAPIPSDGGDPVVPWAKERLLSIDLAERSYSYEVAESNMGFRRYVATIKAKPGDDDDGDGVSGDGCVLEWSFMADPVEGWSRDGLVSYLQNGLEVMGKRIEEAANSG